MLDIEYVSKCLKVEDGAPLRVVEGGGSEGKREQAGERGEGGDCLEGSMPAVVGGKAVEQEGGGRHLQWVFSRRDDSTFVWGLFMKIT